MVGRHQSRAAAHDAVSIRIGVTGEGNIEAVFEANHARHCICGRWVHSDLSIPIDAHKAERGIDGMIYDFEVESVASADRVPVGDARAPQWIRPDMHFAVTN